MTICMPSTVKHLANISYYYRREKEPGKTPGSFWLKRLGCFAWRSWNTPRGFTVLGFCLRLSCIPFLSPLTPVPMQGCMSEGKRGWQEVKPGAEPEPSLFTKRGTEKEVPCESSVFVKQFRETLPSCCLPTLPSLLLLHV